MNTRPPASEPKDHVQWVERETNAGLRGDPLPKYRLNRHHDSGQDGQEQTNENQPDEMLAKERPDPAHGEPSVSGEPSFLVKTIASIVATLGTAGILALTGLGVSTARKVDVLIDRPAPVPLSQYESDMRQLKEEIAATKARVKTIEDRQLESLNKYK